MEAVHDVEAEMEAVEPSPLTAPRAMREGNELGSHMPTIRIRPIRLDLPR